MNRRSFMKKAGVVGTGAAATALAAPAIAQENPEITWRLASSFPKSLDTLWGGAPDVAEQVAALTDGKFKIETYGPGELVPALQVADAVANGTVEAAHTALYYFWGKDPAYAVPCAIPFGLNDRLQNAWLYQGGGNELANEFLATQGLYALPAGNSGCQMGGWFRKEINTIDDLQGLKFRIGGMGGKIFAKLGVVPTSIPGGDIYPALEKGTIDGAEYVGPYDDQKLGFNKVAQYYYYPGWWESGPTLHAVFNLDKYNDLPDHYKAALENACAYANTNMMAKYDVKNLPALKELVGSGTQLRPYSQEIMEAAYAAAVETYAELSEQSPAFKKMYDSHLAFKKDAYTWMQVAEHTFDTFMMFQQRSGKL